MSNITEGLAFEEMQGLVSNVISIDQYKPKVGENADTVVVAFTVQYEKPATDLSNFIETSDAELLDVEASPAPNKNGEYLVFVEFTREANLFDKISKVLEDIVTITSDKGNWEYTAYKLPEPRAFDKERFMRDVVASPEEYRAKFEPTPEQEVKERMEFLVKY